MVFPCIFYDRDLENNKSNIWWIAPAPAIDEIPPAEELQRELEKNTASSCMGKIFGIPFKWLDR